MTKYLPVMCVIRGFDIENEIKKHIIDIHEEIIIGISKYMENKEES